DVCSSDLAVAGGADQAGDQRPELLSLGVGEAVVELAAERAEDGADTLGMVRPRLASDPGDELQEAGGVAFAGVPGLVAPLVDGDGVWEWAECGHHAAAPRATCRRRGGWVGGGA